MKESAFDIQLRDENTRMSRPPLKNRKSLQWLQHGDLCSRCKGPRLEVPGPLKSN